MKRQLHGYNSLEVMMKCKGLHELVQIDVRIRFEMLVDFVISLPPLDP